MLLRTSLLLVCLAVVAPAAIAAGAGEDVWAVARASGYKVDERLAAKAVDEFVSAHAGRAMSILSEPDPAVREMFVRAAYFVAREKVISAQAVMFDAKQLPGFAGSQTGRYLALVIDSLTTPPMDDASFVNADQKVKEALKDASSLRPPLHRCAAFMIRGKAFGDEVAFDAGMRCTKDRKASSAERDRILSGVRKVSFH